MTKFIFLTYFIFQISFLNAQEIKPFQFYNEKGKTVKFDKMIKDLANYGVRHKEAEHFEAPRARPGFYRANYH